MTLLPAQLAPIRRPRWRVPLVATLTVLTIGSLIAGASTSASAGGFGHPFFAPGNLVVSGSVYQSDPSLLTPRFPGAKNGRPKPPAEALVLAPAMSELMVSTVAVPASGTRQRDRPKRAS